PRLAILHVHLRSGGRRRDLAEIDHLHLLFASQVDQREHTPADPARLRLHYREREGGGPRGVHRVAPVAQDRGSRLASQGMPRRHGAPRRHGGGGEDQRNEDVHGARTLRDAHRAWVAIRDQLVLGSESSTHAGAAARVQRFARPAPSRISFASWASAAATTSFTPPTALLSQGYTPTNPWSWSRASIPLLSRSSRAMSASVGSVKVATTSGPSAGMTGMVSRRLPRRASFVIAAAPCRPVLRGCALPPPLPGTCTSAGRALPCSTGCGRGSRRGRSSCASRTPIGSAARRSRCRPSSTGCAGWGSSGTRARKWADRPRLTSRRSAWRPSRSTPRR